MSQSQTAASENRLSDFIHVSCKTLTSLLSAKKCPPCQKLYPCCHLSIKRLANLLVLHSIPAELLFGTFPFVLLPLSSNPMTTNLPILSGGKGVGQYISENFSWEGHIHLLTKRYKGRAGRLYIRAHSNSSCLPHSPIYTIHSTYIFSTHANQNASEREARGGGVCPTLSSLPFFAGFQFSLDSIRAILSRSSTIE